MPEFRLLSYPLTSHAPVWPGNPPAAQTKAASSIATGDVANTTVLTLFSHSGTHFDAPKHFNDRGPSGYQLAVDHFVFFNPLVLELPKSDDEMIYREELETSADLLAEADLVLLRSGWSQWRSIEPERYATKNPMLHPEAARYLLETFPYVRAVGIDAASIGAPGKTEPTIATHQILTGKGREDGRFILIFEDLRIDSDLGLASRIYAWPLFIEESDGSPCTIVAEFDT
jgi:arylformamidase